MGKGALWGYAVYKRVCVFVLSVGERLEGFLCVTVCMF